MGQRMISLPHDYIIMRHAYFKTALFKALNTSL